MDGLFGIEMAESCFAAGREQEIMGSYGVFNYAHHHLRPVRPETIASAHPQRFFIVEGAPVRERLAHVIGRKG